MKIDFRYAATAYEIWALGHMLEVIEPAMESLSNQDETQTLAELESGGWAHDDAEVDLAFQDIREKRDYVLPRFMRGPFIVSLWACFESGVQAVARQMHDEGNTPIALRELRGDSFIARSRRYFEAILEMPLDDDDARYARLVDVYRVRNAMAHANGSRESMAPEQWADLERVLAPHGVEFDDARGVIVLSRAYVEAAYADVAASLRSLVARAREHSDARRLSKEATRLDRDP